MASPVKLARRPSTTLPTKRGDDGSGATSGQDGPKLDVEVSPPFHDPGRDPEGTAVIFRCRAQFAGDEVSPTPSSSFPRQGPSIGSKAELN